jgi:hypothetical protein
LSRTGEKGLSQQTRFAAEASGIGIVGVDGDEAGSEPPDSGPRLAG